jgi:hypothetical protein
MFSGFTLAPKKVAHIKNIRMDKHEFKHAPRICVKVHEKEKKGKRWKRWKRGKVRGGDYSAITLHRYFECGGDFFVGFKAEFETQLFGSVYENDFVVFEWEALVLSLASNGTQDGVFDIDRGECGESSIGFLGSAVVPCFLGSVVPCCLVQSENGFSSQNIERDAFGIIRCPRDIFNHSIRETNIVRDEEGFCCAHHIFSGRVIRSMVVVSVPGN